LTEKTDVVEWSTRSERLEHSHRLSPPLALADLHSRLVYSPHPATAAPWASWKALSVVFPSASAKSVDAFARTTRAAT